MSEITTKEQPKQLTIKQHLMSDGLRNQIAAALPKHMSADRMARVALTTINKTPKLAQCTQESFFAALMTCSQLGLEPDGRLAHLIPYGNQCQLIVDYKGLVDLAYRSKQVLSIHADVIYEGDEFEYDLGQVKKHTPYAWRKDKPEEKGKLLGAYCIVRMVDAEKHEVMGIDEIEAIKKRSKSGSSGPWVTDFNEMAKKGLAIDTPIPTANGFKPMLDIQVGDTVFDMHGIPCTVLAVSDVKSIPCYKITFTDGEDIICDDEHRWVAKTNKSQNNWITYTVNDLYEIKQNGGHVSLPVCLPTQMQEAETSIDPWVLGLWLGDGHSHGASITVGKNDLAYVCERISSSKYRLGKVRQDKNGCYQVGIKGGLKYDLMQLNLLCNKHIPQEFLFSSIEQRLELIRGLMDSDGHITKDRGRAIFENTNMKIVSDMQVVLSSLGEKTTISKNTRHGFGVSCETFRLEWKPRQCPAANPRKVANYRPRKLDLYRAVKSIEKVASVPTKCIGVSSPTETYLFGFSYIPTHNTVFKRCSKWIPLSPEIRDAVSVDDDYEPVLQPKITTFEALAGEIEADPLGG